MRETLCGSGRAWLALLIVCSMFGGCSTLAPIEAASFEPVVLADAGYKAEPFPVQALDLRKIDPAFIRQEVDYDTREPIGSIVVDPGAHYLYLVMPNGRAMRYGVAVGKEGAAWSGTAVVRSKQAWPDWYPVADMLERRPDIKDMLVPIRSGLGIPGGPDNPIGARGLYLWQGNKDTLYRIHGTTEPYTIGQSVSSGCIRMTNQDVIDLYDRVPVGTVVKVLPVPQPLQKS